MASVMLTDATTVAEKEKSELEKKRSFFFIEACAKKNIYPTNKSFA